MQCRHEAGERVSHVLLQFLCVSCSIANMLVSSGVIAQPMQAPSCHVCSCLVMPNAHLVEQMQAVLQELVASARRAIP
jgi:hypothetical protein